MGTKLNPGRFDCYAAAEPDEPMFVLLGRDKQAPYLVRQWAGGRLATEGQMTAKIREALKVADDMERWQKSMVSVNTKGPFNDDDE